jgi:hypothetical protein
MKSLRDADTFKHTRPEVGMALMSFTPSGRGIITP